MTEAPLDLDRKDTARLRKGDLAGLDGLMGRHSDRLLRYLRRLLGDQSVAEDLFQQTWVRAAERIRRYDASRPFAPWLLTVGRNLALDHLRRYRSESLDEGSEPAAPDEGPGAIEDPLARLAARERRERLGAALRELTPHDREVLCLRFEDDLSLKEMAALVSAPLPTVKARLYRALARLRARLVAGGWPEEGAR
ncbi:MAG: sigma-70 family RNA polymerase sigma factor [Acidobacteria bacterium]|jgi:RNA polymerase sigma-70 factor (ECF subfamily)|nr:sigma-70 family RNA polymerase sigma factor [Acidobacteriota bacterium]